MRYGGRVVLRRAGGVAMVCLWFIASPTLEAGEVEKKSAELDSIQDQIEQTETDMEQARRKMDILHAKLKGNETAAGDIALSIKNTERRLRSSGERLDELEARKIGHENRLGASRHLLARQIRSAYITGRNNYLKLLLNQEDPSRVGRLLAYHDYHNRFQARQIKELAARVEKLARLEQEIRREHETLLALQRQQETESRDIAELRQVRSNILEKLRAESKRQELKLIVLRRQETEIKNLLEKLAGRQAGMAMFEDFPSFNTLKGALDWPLRGRLLSRFGSPKQGGKLKWPGVVIDAESGLDVQAIGHGRVVFADWFRNLGLLIIIDHGDSYMSLYGYNQSLLKEAGDWVLPGEVIAHSGDSGGQPRPGVYFEIRENGDPVNPELWCRN